MTGESGATYALRSTRSYLEVDIWVWTIEACTTGTKPIFRYFFMDVVQIRSWMNILFLSQ